MKNASCFVKYQLKVRLNHICYTSKDCSINYDKENLIGNKTFSKPLMFLDVSSNNLYMQEKICI